MRWVLGIVVVLVALAVAIVAFAPASVALGYLRDNSNGALAFEGARGTIWRGSAEGVAINGEPVGRVDWRLSPVAALRSRVDVRLSIAGPRGTGAGRIRREHDLWRISDTQAELPASVLAGLLAPEGLVPHGRVLLELEELSLSGRLPKAAAGRLRWVEARVAGTAHAELGELVAEFRSSSEGRLDGVLSDAGGALGLDGRFHVSWLGYGVEMTLTPRSPGVAAALSRIGQPDDGPARVYAVEGRWLAPVPAPGRGSEG